jgi:NAD(P)-dependent dehydrogenase (short-subunit alcohol dehydrogenase family)
MTAVASVFMTGAGRGLGRLAAEQMLAEHPDIHLVVTVRGSGGSALAADLARVSGNPNVSSVCCDLGSFESIRAGLQDLTHQLSAGQLPPLRGLVANAGLQMASREQASADGIEMTFAVNVLANYLVVRLLWDLLIAPFRIVIVGSDTHFGDLKHNLGMVPGPRWEDVHSLARPRTDAKSHTAAEGRTAYSTSKLAVIYLVHALARRLPNGVDVYTYNPGFVPGTGLVRDAGVVVRLMSRTLLRALIATPVANTAESAGGWLAEAALGPRPAESGSYIDRWQVTESSPESYDKDREEALWTAAAPLCGV